jgi:nucleoside 2-deoxyribosyltransferase
MEKCFVMQPFDGSTYDSRYTDTFAPAISEAGFEPYRVDRDPQVEIPIQDIEEGIRDCTVCLAEVSTDNPNVWFELGYAIAIDKPVCLVCSDERKGKFPFDIQHRKILEYQTRSKSDFDRLQDEITKTLSALRERGQRLQSLQQIERHTGELELQNHEVAALVVLGQGNLRGAMLSWDIEKDMAKAGFNELATMLAVRSLLTRRMVEETQIEFQYEDPATGYRLSDLGVSWLQENIDKLNLRADPKPPRNSTPAIDHDDIPF